MNLMFLHLSDIHFSEANSFAQSNIDGIVSALQSSMNHINTVFIIVSGDIAYGGTKAQYLQAEAFFEGLKRAIYKRYDISDIQLLMVPGNHDVNYCVGVKDLKAEGLRRICDNNLFDQNLPAEFEKQNAAYKFLSKYDCFGKKKTLIDVKTYEYGGKKLQINLINTAVFSSLDEDQSFHYLPQADLDVLSNNSRSDFVFTVMHHPHHWYCWQMKKDLERILYMRTDFLFLGHEHFTSAFNVETKNSAVSIYAGGMLANCGNWDHSQFYIGILNLENREYTSIKYSWDLVGKVYCENEKHSKRLARNRLNSLHIAPTEQYYKKIAKDTKHAICNDIGNYFVFPLLEEQFSEDSTLSRNINDMDNFLHEIEDKRKICIVSHSDFGKTTLSKQIYKNLAQNRVCILLEGDAVGKGNPEAYIRSTFEEIYSSDTTLFEKFKQLPIEEKALIIDDANMIPNSVMKHMLEYAEANFSIIIQTSQQGIELDIRERLKKKNLEEEYHFYRICSFYSDKRKELVSKLVKILIPSDEEVQDRTETMLCDVLSKRRGLFSWNPDFIVQFTKYYCNNIGESIQNDGDIYSKVFESNLTEMIKPHLNRMSPDKAFVILDKIAYRAHVNKEDPVKLAGICEVINQYNEMYGSEINPVEFVTLLLDAGIMKKAGSNYRFSQRNYLAYFVAREIRRKCQEEGDFSEFNKALEYACFGINADIILFVTYITDNVILINRIMEFANQYTEKWEEFSVNPIKIQYLADTNQLQIPPVSEEDRVENTRNEVESEKKTEARQEIIDKESVYNYDETNLKLMDELIRSISLMSIISRVLPNFEHIMPIVNKKRCVELIYALPLKIFNVWAKSLEEVKIELIHELQTIDDYTYRKEKLFESDEDVLQFLRWESVSLFLDLMNTSIRNASRDNTYVFLDGFDYSSNHLYRIEHLMELSKKDAEAQFDKEVRNLYEETQHVLSKLMIQRVTRNYIITSKRIQQPTIQRLNAKIFGDRLNQSAILIQKAKKKREV